MSKNFTRIFLTKQQSEIEKERENLLYQVEELRKNDPFQDPDHASDNAAVDTDVREQVGHDTIEAQIKALQRKLKDIELAREKMSKGKYGYCERCKEAIPIARLRLIPEARFCVDCEGKLYS
ncbi:TraR/DksA C4-type zinc finger protein [Candidatus Roizmanbacteria bacterium]|nr:TraR/DksA C4-type zinc finger protein [Candidatus Roizmanbacteria bacterium]